MSEKRTAAQPLEVLGEKSNAENIWMWTENIFKVREISSLELILVSLMVVLPSIVYGLILIKLPDAKYKVPFQSQV